MIYDVQNQRLQSHFAATSALLIHAAQNHRLLHKNQNVIMDPLTRDAQNNQLLYHHQAVSQVRVIHDVQNRLLHHFAATQALLIHAAQNHRLLHKNQNVILDLLTQDAKNKQLP